jgi:molybdopterin-guanine dinucleotide biosynthesis protein A
VSHDLLTLDRMLMIGSTGANVGKTELACAVISKFSQSCDIIAIKVTTIKAKNGKCPRGGTGCGVCSSLKGDFCITEETNSTSGKDTARLLAAGADRVFWLRVLKESLTEAINTLLDVIPPDVPLVCESNSLRQVIEPGLFLMVTNPHHRVFKNSAQAVKKYADEILVSENGRLHFDIDRIKLVDGKWKMPVNATAIILAGGDSKRMGTDKSMLPIKDKTMIENICEQLHSRFTEIIISAGNIDKYKFLSLKVVPDVLPRQGPLMGIASALKASGNELNFVVACDIPNIPTVLVRRMLAEAEGVDIVVPTTDDEHCEPLFAVYRKSALDAVEKVISGGGHKITDVFSLCKVRYIKTSLPEWFANLNTMAEYEEFLKKYNAKNR